VGDEGPRPGRTVDPEGAHDPGAHDPEAQGTGARDTEVPETAAPRRRAFLRRGLVAAASSVAVALAVSAFATAGPASADVDQRFVDAARAQGYVVVPGDQRTLTVSAARKICDRKDNHATTEQRRATRLSSAEIAAVGQAFGGDVRGFTEIALTTYCPR
jgi:hypothetical protein